MVESLAVWQSLCFNMIIIGGQWGLVISMDTWRSVNLMKASKV